jgi:cytochrome c-type biogenesis protein CcmH/NrfG
MFKLLSSLGGSSSQSLKTVLALIDRITVRAEARPDNADYALLLGEYYLSGNEPAEALRYYDRLIDLGATAPEILGKAAQSEFLSSGRVLNSSGTARAEQAWRSTRCRRPL